MSSKVGLVTVSEPQHPSFMGMRMLRRPTQWGNKMMGTVEEEVERLVNNAYVVAKDVLTKNRDLLDHLSKTLQEQEVVSAEEFQMMLVKFNAHKIDYEVLGDEKSREKLPFQNLPVAV
jgi:cell division protease FtsH